MQKLIVDGHAFDLSDRADIDFFPSLNAAVTDADEQRKRVSDLIEGLAAGMPFQRYDPVLTAVNEFEVAVRQEAIVRVLLALREIALTGCGGFILGPEDAPSPNLRSS